MAVLLSRGHTHCRIDGGCLLVSNIDREVPGSASPAFFASLYCCPLLVLQSIPGIPLLVVLLLLLLEVYSFLLTAVDTSDVCGVHGSQGEPPLVVKVTSFPVPRPAFRRLQYGKAGRAWYIFSREHDVIEKWQNFQNEDAAFCVLFSHLHVQRSVSMTVAPR